MTALPNSNTSLTEKVYSYALLGLLFCLPLFEAPKNLFSLLVFGAAAVLVVKRRIAWPAYSKILLFWIVTALVVSVASKIRLDLSASGFLDIFRFCIVGLAVSLLGSGSFERKYLVFAALLGCLVAALFSAYQIWSGESRVISLKSVGHVNHSAIYLLLSFVVGLALLLFADMSRLQRVVTFIMVSVLPVFILHSHSRAAAGAMIVYLLFVFIMLLLAKRWKTVGFILAISVLTSPVISEQVKRVVSKHNAWAKSYMVDSDYWQTPRGQINQLSLYVFSENPVIGVGYSNYVDYIRGPLKEQLAEKNIELGLRPSTFSFHPHNLYLDYLASSGIVGFIPFVLFWASVLALLYRNRPAFNLLTRSEGNRTYIRWEWVAAGGMVLSNLGVGLFNNPLHHEAALLSLIVISLFVYSVTAGTKVEGSSV